MSITVKTNTALRASTLESLIYDGIENNHIRTWAIRDHSGVRYLTHTPEQWKNKGFLRLDASSGLLQAVFVPATEVPATDEIKGVYQGRFAEMLYTHDQTLFKSGVVEIGITVD
jgi:hypothetical protein